jgi:hypothetical protein
MCKDEKFIKFYQEFFEIKLLPYNLKVKNLYYNCLIQSIEKESIDIKNAEHCNDIIYDFYVHIFKVLRSKEAIYIKCIEKCYPNEEMMNCIEKCTEKTLEVLNQIDPLEEFEKFINY